MTGVPPALDLSQFVGAVLLQLGLGEFQVQFLFQRPETSGADGTVYLGVEGDWDLRDASGTIVDRSVPNAERDALRLHRLLGRAVASTHVDPPLMFALRFDSGDELRVFADPNGYESFSVQPGDVFG